MNENIVATEAVLADVLQNLISQLQSPLPAGVNKIGKVDVDNLNDYTTLLNEIKTAITANLPKDYISKLDEIITAIGEISAGESGTTNEITRFTTVTVPTASTVYVLEADDIYTTTEICLLSNDTPYDLNILFDNKGTNFKLKSGEKLENLIYKTNILGFNLINLPDNIPENTDTSIRVIYKAKITDN